MIPVPGSLRAGEPLGLQASVPPSHYAFGPLCLSAFVPLGV